MCCWYFLYLVFFKVLGTLVHNIMPLHMLSLSVTVILNQNYITLCLVRNVDKSNKRMGNWDKHKSTMNEQIGQAQNTAFNGKQIHIVK